MRRTPGEYTIAKENVMMVARFEGCWTKFGISTVVAGCLSVGALAQTGSMGQVTQHYTQKDLTSNMASLAPVRDQNLVNPWGISRSSGGPWWVSDNGTGLSTLYDGTGAVQGLVVKIPAADPNTPTGSPTGTMFNGGPGFAVSGKPALFLFVTEDGTISGWNPQVNPTSAVIAVNEKNHSVYKGATIATAMMGVSAQQYMYVADFYHGKVQVFDSSFRHVPNVEGMFEQRGGDEARANGDGQNMEGFAPFNVQNIGGNIYVSYAKQSTNKFDEVDGTGLGFVQVYSPEGRRLMTLERGSFFNAPWGITLAPSDFGQYSHDLLVGQFGSGEIVVFDPITGRYLGKLSGTNNAPLKIMGLWGISVGNGLKSGPATSLYFAAGVNGEQGGLFGSITAVENPQGNDQ